MDKKKTRYIPVAYDDLKTDVSGPLMYDAETNTAFVGENSIGTESNSRTVKVFDCTFKPSDGSTEDIITTDHIDEIFECIQTFTPFAIRNISTPDSVITDVYWYGMVHGTNPNKIITSPSSYDIPSVDRVTKYYLPRYSIRIIWTPTFFRFQLWDRSNTDTGVVTQKSYTYDEDTGYCYYSI